MFDNKEHSPPSKQPTVSPVTPCIDWADQIEGKMGNQDEHDEQLARMLQESYDSTNSLVVDNVSTQSADDITDSLSVVKNLVNSSLWFDETAP